MLTSDYPARNWPLPAEYDQESDAQFGGATDSKSVGFILSPERQHESHGLDQFNSAVAVDPGLMEELESIVSSTSKRQFRILLEECLRHLDVKGRSSAASGE